MGSVKKQLKKAAHLDRGEQDARLITEFLDNHLGEERLVVGVLNQRIADEVLKHLRPDLHARVRFVVGKKQEAAPVRNGRLTLCDGL